MNIKLKKLNKTIINCNECPRLINFIKKISKEKRRQNINETYWGKPVTGFGNLNSRLLILGLAPAAHSLEINQVNFYLNVYIKLKYQINLIHLM